MKLLLAVAACAVLATAPGCKKSSVAEARPLGQKLYEGKTGDIRLSPDGKQVAFLVNVQKPVGDGLPPQMVAGELGVVSVSGGAARMLGKGVVNLPGGFLFTPDSGRLLFLSEYKPSTQEGNLFLADLTTPGAPAALGKGVKFVAVSDDSKYVAFIEGGVLKVGPVAGPWAEVSGEAASVEFAPNGAFVLFKRRLSANSALFVASLSNLSKPTKLGEQVGDYSVSGDSRRVAFTQPSPLQRGSYDLHVADPSSGKAQRVGGPVNRFAFSPDSKWLARLEVERSDEPGKLFVGTSSGGVGQALGQRVQEFSFSPDSSAVAFLDKYHVPTRAGVLTVATIPDGKPKAIGYRVPYYVWGSTSRYLAFSAGVLKPIFSLDLMVYAMGAEKAQKVSPWVYGYSFAPDDSYLLSRAGCIRNGRACDLFYLNLKEKAQEPVKTLDGVYSFKPSPDGTRLLLTYARTDSELYDVASYNFETKARKVLAERVGLPALFVDGGKRALFRVADGERAGVYLSEPLP